MPTRAAVLCERTVGRKKRLRLARRFESLHPLLALAGGLVRVLGAILAVPVLALFHSRE